MSPQNSEEFHQLSYQNILKATNELKRMAYHQEVSIKILANTTINQCKELFEYQLLRVGIKPDIHIGNYDNIIQESVGISQADVVIVFWDVINMVEGLQYKIELYDSSQIDELLQKTLSEMDLVFDSLKNVRLVVFNKFNVSPFTSNSIKQTKLETFCQSLNESLIRQAPSNFTLVNIDKVYLQHSVGDCIDYRFFHSTKAFYSITFFKAYVSLIMPVILSTLGRTKKVMVLDCDNTLWKGVVGEDGMEGINLSASSPAGKIFQEIQSLVKAAKDEGVLLAICSKNNFKDVMEVFRDHPEMILSPEDIIISKINWEDKASNIRSIAEELNVGIDSIVFVDDADYEINLIQTHLTSVQTFRVPDKIYRYPFKFRELLTAFYSASRTSEDLQRTKLYKVEKERHSEKGKHQNLEDYIRSLNLKVDLKLNDLQNCERLTQLTQKTNQFNLTTKRYTFDEMNRMIRDPHFEVFSMSADDKFGSYGITGLAIVERHSPNSIEIDSFLLSCRVIGRNLESVLFNSIVSHFPDQEIKATYFKTPKNSQVMSFFENQGMTLLSNESDEFKQYVLSPGFQPRVIDYIERIEHFAKE